MDLTALASFNIVAEHGGFGRASRAVSQPKPTLSRHVRELEDDLGVRLVKRGGQSLRLTDEGTRLYAQTRGLLAEINEAEAQIRSGGPPHGRLRVSAPVLFSHISMGQIATGFAKAFPAIELHLTVQDRRVDLVEEGYDVIIRINPEPTEDLVGRRFLVDQMVVVAPPGLTRLSGDANAVVPAVLSTTDTDNPSWTIVDGTVACHYKPKSVMRISSLLVMHDQVRAGLGAALLPRSLVAADLADGRLALWGTDPHAKVEGWVLHSSRRLVSPKVEAFVTYLCEAFPRSKAADLPSPRMPK